MYTKYQNNNTTCFHFFSWISIIIFRFDFQFDTQGLTLSIDKFFILNRKSGISLNISKDIRETRRCAVLVIYIRGWKTLTNPEKGKPHVTCR